jgi:hypothetical protein
MAYFGVASWRFGEFCAVILGVRMDMILCHLKRAKNPDNYFTLSFHSIPAVQEHIKLKEEAGYWQQ